LQSENVFFLLSFPLFLPSFLQKEKEVHQQVQQEYSSLVDSLFSTSAAIKNRFEDYR